MGRNQIYNYGRAAPSSIPPRGMGPEVLTELLFLATLNRILLLEPLKWEERRDIAQGDRLSVSG